MALRGTLTHRKTRRLARELGISLPFSLGLMEALWHVTAENTPNGAIGQITNQDIADEMFWEGDADTLVHAFIASGILDPDQQFRLVVHGWAEHADQATKRKLARNGQSLVMASHRLDASSTPVPVPEPDSVPDNPHPKPPPQSEREPAALVTAGVVVDSPDPQDSHCAKPANLTPREEAVLLISSREGKAAIRRWNGALAAGKETWEEYCEAIEAWLEGGAEVTAETLQAITDATWERYREKGGGRPRSVTWWINTGNAMLVKPPEVKATAAPEADDLPIYGRLDDATALRRVIDYILAPALVGDLEELNSYEPRTREVLRREHRWPKERIDALFTSAYHTIWTEAKKTNCTATVLQLPQFAEYRTAQA